MNENTANKIAAKIAGSPVEYTTLDGEMRNFFIVAIERVALSAKSGEWFATCEVKDLDDGGKEKFRSLILSGI